MAIVAFDFDGILCENKFPQIGEPKYFEIEIAKKLIKEGHEVVLWTSRNGKELAAAVTWCKHYGLEFCAVNEPAPSNREAYKDKYPTESRKIYADIYIDDHNLGYSNALVRHQLNNLLKESRQWKKAN